MAVSKLLRTHVAEGKVTIGVNHEMLDFKQHRKKNLDLVIAKPASESSTRSVTLSDLGEQVGAVLDASERAAFDRLPSASKQPVGSVLLALEAKACMTEHSKSLPRLYDELNSSQQTVHGANDAAIACGLVMVNFAESFVSPGRQHPGAPVNYSRHKQPVAAESVIRKVRELPRRTSPGSDGFDAVGIIGVDLANDGSPVRAISEAPAPQQGDGDTYQEMIARVASLYEYRFSML